jgi:hypothetical protein
MASADTSSDTAKSKTKLRTITPSTDSIYSDTVINTTTLRSDSKNDESDVLFDRKVEVASEGLIPSFSRCFYDMPSKNNALTLAEYIIALKSEINLSDNYRKDIIQRLSELSVFMVRLYSKKCVGNRSWSFLIICVSQKLRIHFTNG